MQKLNAFLLFLGAALLPVYVFGSGGIQPTHMLLAAFAVLTFFSGGLPLTLWSLALLAMFLHAFAVESVYAMMGGEPRYLINSVFFLFNFLVAGTIYTHVRRHGPAILVPGILIATAIALATIVAGGVDLRDMGEGGRATGTFNNPNQLGYFSVCLLSLAYLLYRDGRMGYLVTTAVLSVSLFLAISSLSKAAMITNFVVIVLALKPAASRNALIGWSVAALAGIMVVFRLYQNGAFDGFLFMERLANMANEGDSSLEARGYFAFLDGNILQVLFGLGTQRVNEIIGHEVHSTLGSTFNNYGFIGLLFFSTALAVWVMRLWRSYGFVGAFCMAAPALLYGITHNGTRFTIFWLLFAASLAGSERMRSQREPRPAIIQNRSISI
ncbi:MAG: hypothetical protein M5U35_06650 [Roseovarius sp.]|nr:hypothetical protein [Roseovarius sp.]